MTYKIINKNKLGGDYYQVEEIPSWLGRLFGKKSNFILIAKTNKIYSLFRTPVFIKSNGKEVDVYSNLYTALLDYDRRIKYFND